MKMKELEPETRESFEVTIEGMFEAATMAEHVMAMETTDSAFLFIDTERGRDKGVLVLSHEELIMLVWDAQH